MPRYLKSDLLCLLTATIWGFAFVAQRVGMDHVGPFTFNGIRFLLGALVLVPFIWRNRGQSARQPARHFPGSQPKLLFYGSLAGLALFGGASLQQVGLVYTTAGNAGFITGLYVVLVPIMGLLWGQQTNAGTWLGALMAAIGLYLLSIKSGFTISFGDFLELLGALLWAAHIHLIGWVSPKTDSLKLAFVQFMVCALASLATAVGIETASVARVAAASTAILYGGVLSVGVAYTLQVVAQRDAHPAHAAILLCLESVFAAVGGWLVLDEVMAGRAMIGCVLMLAGMLVSQLYGLVTHRSQSNT
ncbi:DMT family transporter [Desulfosarcina ovata]|uniref:Transporter n=1 Tax=Desulfosarcina ovata subsp. ovata TaxID=2752305 RepID=A0A5K8ADV1_9BACT|nr:DMT family transporter [Desulfosarcina ovata]BBO90802.1 transporter [Desulfosarcina ovata subsp. ovata]